MALYCLRLRRTLTSLSTLHRSLSTVPAIPAISTPALQGPTSTSTPSHPWALLVQSRPFRLTTVALFSARSSYNSNSTDEIGPDTILFEGCDYNHWLIVMTFPKDDKPTPEQMVQTYEETCAKGLNISVEEAKQKIYACSTTTYEGFQAVMTEEESNKFQGLPGVTFVLPDSYIDPVNKEYGGDKYVNGTIIPRPPPVQYWKQGRNRSSPDRRYGREGPPPTNQQYRPSNDYQVSRDGRNHGAPQNYPSQQNYAPPGPGERRDSMPMNRNQGAPQNYPSQQNYAPPGPGERRDPMPMNRNQGAPENYPSQQNYAPPGPGERRDPMPTSRNYAPGGMGTYQSGRGDPIPPYQGNYNPGGQGDYSPQQQRDFPQVDQSHYVPPAQGNFVGANRSYGPSQDGTYGRGAAGYQGQETYGASGQGASSGYERNYPGHGEGQRFSQEEQRNWQGEQRTNAPRGPAGPTGSDQGRY